MITYDGQTARFLGAIAQNMPKEISGDVMQGWIDNPKGLQKTLRAALCPPVIENGGKATSPSPLKIDRTLSFDPAKFIGEGWTIWKGPAPPDGDGLTGEEEQDAASLALTEVDFTKVLFETTLTEGEPYVTGEEKLKRHITAKRIRLDASVGQALFEELGHTTLKWLYKTFKITWFELPGTTLRDPHGSRCFLGLCRGDGRWYWSYRWLGHDRFAGSPSAVLAKSELGALAN